MHWNVRIVKTGTIFELREVYYDDQGRPEIHGSVILVHDTDVDGDDLREGISSLIGKLDLALDKPALTYPEDFLGEE